MASEGMKHSSGLLVSEMSGLHESEGDLTSSTEVSFCRTDNYQFILMVYFDLQHSTGHGVDWRSFQ